MTTRATTRRAPLYAAEAPKPWAELREEELERENFTPRQLDTWARAHGLEDDTLVLWLMPQKKARELARHWGDEDSEPVRWPRSKLVLLEETREEAEPGWVLATLVPPPEPEPEELVVLPPRERRAWSLKEALAMASKVEALYLIHGEPLAPELARLERLRLLELDGTPSSQWPEELCGLAALEMLSISGMPLSHLPPGFARLGQLKVLHLSRTRLERLPEVLGELPRLTELRVEPRVLGASGEGLKHLGRMPSLRRLEVIGASPRPSWLVPPEGFREGDEDSFRVTFLRESPVSLG